MDCLCFSVDGQRYAVEVGLVRKVLPSVWISPLHNSPRPVAGVINVQGQVIPVVDLRQRLSLPGKPLGLTDRILWVESAGWDLAMIADRVDGVMHIDASAIMNSLQLPAAPALLHGVATLPDGLLLIQNPAALLELQEREALQDVLAHADA